MYSNDYIKPKIIRRTLPQVASTVLSSVSPLLRRLYLARGVRFEHELNLSLGNLQSPYGPQGLNGLDAAVTLLAHAITHKQPIIVIGDYDADGATASALCVLVLQALGAQYVDFLIPNRFTMGYGLSPELVDQAASRGAKLILTVDTGITSIAGVTKARSLGLQIVITDHHLPGALLPTADAIVNPNLPQDKFPSKYTAGVGVAFYVLAALRRHLQPTLDMEEFLDLVALGTVADVVPLDYNNRILVQHGLKNIRNGRCRPCIAALLQVAGRSMQNVTAQDLAFHIGPRLNAAGRLENMDLGLACLLCTDPVQALAHAQRLNELNLERRDIEAQMDDQAKIMLDAIDLQDQSALGLCLYDEGWHQGIIGIIAGRLKDRHQRPTIALALGDDGTIKGSARSIPEVHMRDLLAGIEREHPKLMIRYGGHAMAAGLTLSPEQLPTFRNVFAKAVQDYLGGSLPQAQILSDGSLQASEINIDTARTLRQAGPWGQGFPVPLFDGEFRVRSQRRVGNDHLKLLLEVDGHTQVDAIAFRWGAHALDAEWVHIAYRLDLNEYRGRETPQLIIEHLEPA